jgi:uncharacterized protein involved in exopolysaccharide biosynthesis
MEEEQEKRVPWQEMVEVGFRRWRVIIALAVVGILLAAARAISQPPLYRATATILIKAQRTRVTVSPDANSGVTVDPVLTTQEVALLKSPSLMREVLARHHHAASPQPVLSRLIGLFTNPSRIVELAYESLHQIEPADPLDQRAATVLSEMAINPLPNTNLIAMSYVSEDPEWSATLVNELLAQHISRNARLGEQADALKFFEEQKLLLAEKRDRAQAALEEFREQHGLADLVIDDAHKQTATASLQLSYSQAQTEFQEATARVEYLRRELARLPRNIAQPRAAESPSLQLLRNRQLELELDRSELLSRYAPGSTVVRDLERQMEEVARMLAEEQATVTEAMTMPNPAQQTLQLDLVQAEAQLAAVTARVQAIASQMSVREMSEERFAHLAPELDRLENEVQSAALAYKTYLQKEEEARFSQALDESKIVNLSVMEWATPPSRPLPNRVPRAIVMGSAVGLLFGMGLAFVRDWMDPTLKSTAQVQRLTELPVLAEIPS